MHIIDTEATEVTECQRLLCRIASFMGFPFQPGLFETLPVIKLASHGWCMNHCQHFGTILAAILMFMYFVLIVN